MLRITLLLAFNLRISRRSEHRSRLSAARTSVRRTSREKLRRSHRQVSSKPSRFAPDRASIRKDLAYTLLKDRRKRSRARPVRRSHAASILPIEHVALEYAFLCYETKQQAIARRIFDRIRKTGDATAEQAFQNIDQPLAEGIARWTKALEMSPGQFQRASGTRDAWPNSVTSWSSPPNIMRKPGGCVPTSAP